MKMIAPILLGTQAGSMIGSLARNALGRYDLPLPTSDAPGPTFVLANLLEFESEWSIEPQDLRLYIALHEAVHTSIRCRPWVQSALARIANEYVSGFDIDVARLEEQFGGLDPTNPESIAAAAEQPDAILGAMRSPRQEPAARSLRCLVIAMVGYGDCVLEHLGRPLLPEFGKIHELPSFLCRARAGVICCCADRSSRCSRHPDGTPRSRPHVLHSGTPASAAPPAPSASRPRPR